MAMGAPIVGRWDDALATRCVRAVVRKQFSLGRFDQLRELTEDDVTRDLASDAWREFHKFDPDRGSFSTWITTFANTRVHNVHRGSRRSAIRQGQYAVEKERTRDHVGGIAVVHPTEVIEPSKSGETVDGEIVGGDGQLPLVDWLGQAYRYAKRLTAERSRQGMTYEPAQALAVAAIARKLGLSVRGTRGLFEDRSDLRSVVGFSAERFPSRDWFCLALREVKSLS